MSYRAPSGGAPASHSFGSILFEDPVDRDGIDGCVMPEFFQDLALDQVVESVLRGREAYNLAPFFYRPLQSTDAVAYRQEVMRDVGQPAVQAAVTAFADAMRVVRGRLTKMDGSRHPIRERLLFLDAVRTYVDGVERLQKDLSTLPIRSRGLRGLAEYLSAHTGMRRFTEKARTARILQQRLGDIRYTVQIRGDRVRVSRYQGQTDYSSEIAAFFARFRQSDADGQRGDVPVHVDMNPVEATVLEYVAGLYPDLFGAVGDFYRQYPEFLDTVIADFDREAQFYLAWTEYVDYLGGFGLRFCLPEVSATDKELHVEGSFDVALADRLVPASRPVICNDIDLHGAERILVVTGPNQGGKTTFARMAGQLHHLARIGCPIPGHRGQVFLVDQIFTHFPRAELANDPHGNLAEELLDIRRILDRASAKSLVVVNELFTSTALQDALYLSDKIMRRLAGVDLICVYVTFIDELSRWGPGTVSMVSTVKPDDPSERTFKVIRGPADGLAHSAALAGKYGLTYERLKDRIGA
jgi:DNA mismatch repair protein MutS